METNEAVITVITLAIILGIIGAFAVLITIKYKYPAIFTKKIDFESSFNYNINFNPEVIRFITGVLINPTLYSIDKYSIYNIYTDVGIWIANDINNREFYYYSKIDEQIIKYCKDINSKLTMADKYLLEQFKKYITNRLEEYKDTIIYKSNITIKDILDSLN